MSIDEPQFTYKSPTDEERSAFKAHQERMAAAAAIISEARAHQWEHRQPIGATLGDGVAERIRIGEQAVRETFGLAQSRTFTREEVLTVLKALGGELKAQGIHSAGLLAVDRARAIFENME